MYYCVFDGLLFKNSIFVVTPITIGGGDVRTGRACQGPLQKNKK